MNRRRFLKGAELAVVGATIGVGSVVAYFEYGSEGSSNQISDEQQISPEVEKAKPLAEDFFGEINQYFDSPHIYIVNGPEIAMEYSTGASSDSELQTEFHQIAEVYADLVKGEEYSPLTLSIIVGEVQAIAPQTSLKAYVDGSIDKEAFLKTIQVTDIERRD